MVLASLSAVCRFGRYRVGPDAGIAIWSLVTEASFQPEQLLCRTTSTM